MILYAYSVYDSAVKAWRSPFFARAKGEVLRSWIEAVNRSDTDFGKHPDDYFLYEIGTFDDQNCCLEVYAAPDRIGSAREYVDPIKTGMQQVAREAVSTKD